MAKSVKFISLSQEQYDDLDSTESGNLYFTNDTHRIYKGGETFGGEVDVEDIEPLDENAPSETVINTLNMLLNKFRKTSISVLMMTIGLALPMVSDAEYVDPQFCLHRKITGDVPIITNMVDYAEGIGDQTLERARLEAEQIFDEQTAMPKYHYSKGRWYIEDIVDRGPDDITITLERYGDDVYMWFDAVDGSATVTFTNKTSSATAPKLERLYNGEWKPFSFPVNLAKNERICFRTQYGVTNGAYWTSSDNNWKFGGTGKYAVGGNIKALFVYEGDIECPTNAVKEMFKNNLCLVDASKLVLSFDNLSEECYAHMFNDCVNLTKCPYVLPAKNIPREAYMYMFKGCSSLSFPPRILAENAVEELCMGNMFEDCSSLDHLYLPYLTNISETAIHSFASHATNVSRIATLTPDFSPYFANGVQENGVMICRTELGTNDNISRGADGCPQNWIVENLDSPFIQFTNAYGVPSEVKMIWSSGTVPKLEYSLDNGSTWNVLSLTKGVATSIAVLNNYGDKVLIRAQEGKTNVALNGSRFITTGKLDVSGNIMSLISQSCPTTISKSNMFQGLFGLTSTPTDADGNPDEEGTWDCEGIAASDGLTFPSTNTQGYCYDSIFAHCRRMRYSPLTLPVKSLAIRAHAFFFWRCIEMVETPDILASSATGILTLRSTFMNCISIKRARFPNFVNVTQGSTFNWALRCDQWFSHQDVKLEYIETAMDVFKNNQEWVQGLEYTKGLFVCPTKLGNRFTIPRGDSGCPENWDVVNK